MEKENQKLREDVTRLKELVKLQREVTHGTVFTETSMVQAARNLKKSADAKGSTKELVGLLQEVCCWASARCSIGRTRIKNRWT